METMQTFKKFFYSKQVQNEGFLRNLAAGAMLGASLLGGVSNADAASKQTKPAVTQSTNQNWGSNGYDKFANIWAKKYNAEKKDRSGWAKEQIRIRKSMPNRATINGIRKACACFEGDAGIDKVTMSQLLLLTGRLESNYSSSNLASDTGARGYFQVLASTSQDRLKTGKAYFGPKFEKIYKPKVKQLSKGKWKGSAVDYFKSLSFEQFRNLLKNDPEVCAAFAAVKWVTIGQELNNKQTKILNSIFKKD